MRRALLTATKAAATPVSVGNDGTFGTSNSGIRSTEINNADPATATSTIVTVKMQVITAGTFYVMTGTISGTTYTVRAISTAISGTVGLNTVTVSLAVVAGDYIGVVSPDGGRIGGIADGTKSFVGSTNTTVPAPGGTITGLSTVSGTRPSLLGTNP